MDIRRLVPADAAAYQALRLSALRDAPSAFASSHEEEQNLPLPAIEDRLAASTDRGVFGAFDDGALVGMVGLGRQNAKKLSHKAFIWGMYVAPGARGRGIGRALLATALSLAESVPEIRQVNLCVNVSNTAAIQLYESLGFQTFGREPNAMLVDGTLHDDLHMYRPATGPFS